MLNNRLTGSFDWYYRKTTDLLNTVYVPAGSNFRNQVISNIGDLSNTGVEATVSYTILNEQNTKDWFWKVDYNFTYNRNKITNLTGGDANYYVTPGSMAIQQEPASTSAHTRWDIPLIPSWFISKCTMQTANPSRAL